MPGRPEFSQPGTQGGGQTVAVQNRPNVKVVSEFKSTTVAAGSNETIMYYAPEGAVWRVKSFKFSTGKVSNATTGDHSVKVHPAGSGLFVLLGSSGYNDGVKFNGGAFRIAKQEQIPGDAAGQNSSMQSLMADEDSPIEVNYSNNTDADHTDDREIRLVVEEVTY